MFRFFDRLVSQVAKHALPGFVAWHYAQDMLRKQQREWHGKFTAEHLGQQQARVRVQRSHVFDVLLL